MCSSRWTSMLIIVVGLWSAAPVGATSGHANVAGAPLEAIWRVQEFELYVTTGKRYHSCSSLHQKISRILVAVGAGSVEVKLSCDSDQLTNIAHARVATAAPIGASAESIAAATTFDSRDALVARLRSAQLPTPTDIQRFPAEWRTVSLTRNRALQLGQADCELLRGINDQIFPHLSIRVVRKSLSCGSLTQLTQPTLVVEALVRREA